MENVVIKGAPGYREFLATTIPGLDPVPAVDGRGDLVVVVVDGDLQVVPARFVHHLSADEVTRIRNARLYRREWAVKTGRSEREVYVPAGIRPHVAEEAW